MRDHKEMTRVTHWYSSKCHEDRWTSVLEFSHRTKDFTAQKLKPVGHAITLSTFSNHNTRVMQRYRDSDAVGDRLFYWVTTLLSAIHQDEPVDVSGFTSGYKMLLKAKRVSFTYNSPFWYIACKYITNMHEILIKSLNKIVTSTCLFLNHISMKTQTSRSLALHLHEFLYFQDILPLDQVHSKTVTDR